MTMGEAEVECFKASSGVVGFLHIWVRDSKRNGLSSALRVHIAPDTAASVSRLSIIVAEVRRERAESCIVFTDIP